MIYDESQILFNSLQDSNLTRRVFLAECAAASPSLAETANNLVLVFPIPVDTIVTYPAPQASRFTAFLSDFITLTLNLSLSPINFLSQISLQFIPCSPLLSPLT